MWKRLVATFRSRRLDGELDEEVRFHLEMLEQEHRARGLSGQEARLAARRDFGAISQMKEAYRERRGFTFFETLAQDVCYGARVLRRNPAFTIAAVISLALGIGANTAVFSVFNALLLRALPVERPGELVHIRKTGGPQYLSNFSYPLYTQIRARRDLLDGVVACSVARRARVLRQNGSAVEFAFLEFVSGNYFEVLGLRPSAGRLIAASEELPAGAHPVAVISHEMWRTRFAFCPAIAGTPITIDGKPYTIAGVAPPGFRGLDPGFPADMWLPLAMSNPRDLADDSRMNWLRVVGRKKPGVSLSRIASAANTIYRAELNAKGSLNSPWRKTELAMRAEATSAASGVSGLKDRFREPLRILMALVAMLLLIACANVSNLMLARGAARSREMAVRLSIGAGRLRLVRQCMTEGLLLAAAAGALGLAIALGGSSAIVSFLPAGDNVVPLDVHPDGSVLFFTAAVSLGAALLFALFPALRSTRLGPAAGLKQGNGANGSSPARARAGNVLVAVQVTLSLVLLVGAGLFVRTLAQLRHLDPGFRQENVITFWLDLPGHYTPEQGRNLEKRLLERFSAIPGVTGVSYGSLGPYMSGRASGDVTVNTPEGPKETYVDIQMTSPRYFVTLGVPVLRGRFFDEHDRDVAVINESFVRQMFGSADPVGRTITIERPRTIIGVVRDVMHMGLREKPSPTLYLPVRDSAHAPAYDSFQIRTAVAPDALIETLRREAASIDGAVALADPRSLSSRIDESLMRERLMATVSAFFAALALILAAVGLYGVLSYSVARRTGEIGIRMALGADRGKVLRAVLCDAAALAGAGIGAGLAIALPAARVTASLLFGVEPKDAATYTSAAVLLLSVAMLAAWFPARRAASISPTQALRHE